MSSTWILNAWYVAAASAELTGSPLGRRLCGEDVVLFRGPGGPRRVSRQPALSSLQELLRPDIIEALGDALLAADLGDAVLAAEAIQHDPDLVFGGEMPPRRAPDVLRHLLARRRLPGDRLWSHLMGWTPPAIGPSMLPQQP